MQLLLFTCRVYIDHSWIPMMLYLSWWQIWTKLIQCAFKLTQQFSHWPSYLLLILRHVFPTGQSTFFIIISPDSGKAKGVNTGRDSGWDLIPGQYGHVCGSRLNQWTSSGHRVVCAEDQQDYADGASEGQTFRHETYLSVTNVLCKSLAKKVVCFQDSDILSPK